MNQLGHWGIVLFVFGFVVFGLVARDRTRAAKIVTVTALGVGLSPDVDLHVAWLAHRGITHTLPAALVAGGVLATVAWIVEPFALTDPREEAFYGFLTGSVGVTSHLLGDIITPMGLKPLYPFMARSYTLDLVSAHNDAANVALLVFGIMAYQTMVRHARTHDPVPTYAAGFRRSDLGLESDADTDA